MTPSFLHRRVCQCPQGLCGSKRIISSLDIKAERWAPFYSSGTAPTPEGLFFLLPPQDLRLQWSMGACSVWCRGKPISGCTFSVRAWCARRCPHPLPHGSGAAAGVSEADAATVVMPLAEERHPWPPHPPPGGVPPLPMTAWNGVSSAPGPVEQTGCYGWRKGLVQMSSLVNAPLTVLFLSETCGRVHDKRTEPPRIPLGGVHSVHGPLWRELSPRASHPQEPCHLLCPPPQPLPRMSCLPL